MPFYDHKCEDCGKISDHMYGMSKDPKEIECPFCGSKNTVRLIGKIHIGWERKMLGVFKRGEDERSAAQEQSHMGPNPYEMLSGEEA